MARKNSKNSRYVTYAGLIICIIIFLGLTGCGKDNPTTPNNPEPENPGTPPETEMTLSQTIQEDDDLSMLEQLITDAGMEDVLKSEGPYTILAPVNSAFDNLPDGFLDNLSPEELQTLVNYHLIDSEISGEELSEQDTLHTMLEDPVFVLAEGKNTYLNHGLLTSSSVIESDIQTSNGIIHKVDGLLQPDIFLDVLSLADKRYSRNLSKFVCNCTTGDAGANLQPVLQNRDKQLTVFVPTDDAFEASNIYSLPQDGIRNVIEYHIVEEVLLSDNLTDNQKLATLNGDSLTVSVAEDGTITLDGGAATVIEKDLEGANGVVYVIDAVLSPPDE